MKSIKLWCLLVLKLLLLISPAVIYAVGRLVRLINWFYNIRHPGVDLWQTRVENLVRDISIILIPLIISAILHCVAVAKKKQSVVKAFRIWLITSAIISIFWTSLDDGVIISWLEQWSTDPKWFWSNIGKLIIYFSYFLYIVVVVFFMINTKQLLEKQEKKEILNKKEKFIPSC